MSEETEVADAGGEAGPGVDPAAIALALASASRNKADRFLEEQIALIGLQKHHLHEQFKNLRLIIWEKRMGVFLRVATAVVGVAVAALLGAAVWDAAHDDGLVIEAFSVPPDLAARGLTGQVVAGELLGNLAELQTKSQSVRAASSYT